MAKAAKKAANPGAKFAATANKRAPTPRKASTKTPTQARRSAPAKKAPVKTVAVPVPVLAALIQQAQQAQAQPNPGVMGPQPPQAPGALPLRPQPDMGAGPPAYPAVPR